MNAETDLIRTLVGHGWSEIRVNAPNIRCFRRDNFQVNVFLNTGTLALINLYRGIGTGGYVMTTDTAFALFDMTVTQEEFMDTVCGKPPATSMRLENLKNLKALEALR